MARTMARALPDGWDAPPLADSARAEIETLRQLARGLPDTWAVYHGVHWTKVDHGHSIFGEVDFIVTGPAGQLVLIEQKRGPLEETPDGLVKRYPDKPKVVKVQMQRSIDALQSRFKQGHKGERLTVDYLLYCPDHRVASPATAGIAPERIVDARAPGRLCEVVSAMVNALADTRGPSPQAVHAFLADELDLAVEPGVFESASRRWVTRLSGGLATWARKLEFEPFRLRVIGTAGSGKTQLALRVLQDAASRGERALYVCFNRPLADRIAQLAPPGAKCATFHMLGDEALRATGEAPDFSAPDAFDRLADAFAARRPTDVDRLDVIVVDEGQDFSQTWANALMRWGKPGGNVWWLEDPMQNLYDRPEVALPGWVKLHADTNFRTPRDMLEKVSRMTGGQRVDAGSPVEGGGIDTVTYTDFNALADATVAAVQRAREAGFRNEDIAILTFGGRERSHLMAFDTLRGIHLRRFQGTYTADGKPIFDSGDVLLETVYRFKGQSAPCVILTEIDFDAIDERVARRLYVGATRATLRLSMVMSERAARCVLERLG